MAEAETAKKLMGTAGPYGNGLTKTETAAAATNSRDSRDTKEALKVRERAGANKAAWLLLRLPELLPETQVEMKILWL